MATSQISIDSLKSITNKMITDTEKIMEIYKTQVTPLITSSKQCLTVSGLNYDEIVNTFDTTFNNLNTKMTNLTDTLKNKVIPSYSDVSTSIKTMFNNEFATKMQELLGINH